MQKAEAVNMGYCIQLKENQVIIESYKEL